MFKAALLFGAPTDSSPGWTCLSFFLFLLLVEGQEGSQDQDQVKLNALWSAAEPTCRSPSAPGAMASSCMMWSAHSASTGSSPGVCSSQPACMQALMRATASRRTCEPGAPQGQYQGPGGLTVISPAPSEPHIRVRIRLYLDSYINRHSMYGYKDIHCCWQS